MNICKKVAVAGALVLSLSAAAFAELEVTPYGAAQYRLRFEHNLYMHDGDAPADDFGTFDYSNRLSYRVGLRAKWDDQFSAQFQIGNDWGQAENVGWASNRNGGRLYVHLAYFKWNPGPVFLEAGVVPINAHGALDFFERSLQVTGDASLAINRYGETVFDGWGNQNNSLVGVKLGVPLLSDDFKLGVELTQSVIDARTQGTGPRDNDGNVTGNPSSIMTVLQIPMSVADFRITPEVALIFNRDVARGEGDLETVADHEMAFGAAGGYKISDDVSLTFRAGYAMYSNANRMRDADATEEWNGLLAGVGASIKAGPGTLQVAVDFNTAENGAVDDDDITYLYTDIRYGIRLHPRLTFTPRYRTYTRMFTVPDGTASMLGTRLGNRFELIVEGSF